MTGILHPFFHMMVPTLLSTALFAATQSVQHRISSVLINSFSQWWQMPLFVVGLATVGLLVLWMYRRDAAEVPFGVGVVLATLRLGALAAMAAAYRRAADDRHLETVQRRR